MGQLADIISNAINYMKTAQVSDIIDIILVAVLIYVAIGLIRRTNTTRLARGIVFIILALWLSDLLKFRNFGKKSLSELDDLLESLNLSFGTDISKYKLDKES